jgi:hypothetical protein
LLFGVVLHRFGLPLIYVHPTHCPTAYVSVPITTLHTSIRRRLVSAHQRSVAHAVGVDVPDWKECIDIGRDGKSDIDGENQWPDAAAAPQFRPCVERYYRACERLSLSLLRACAVGLGMPPRSFDHAVHGHTSYLRLNFYPTCALPASAGHDSGEPHPEQEGSLGINKHTDAGAITVLRQYPGEPASLQVLNAHGNWIRVVPVEGAMTINIGDMMQVGVLCVVVAIIVWLSIKSREIGGFYGCRVVSLGLFVTNERSARKQIMKNKTDQVGCAQFGWCFS